MRAFAMTGIDTVLMMSSIRSGSLMRATPPWARMSAGTRSRAMTATAPASSAIFACSAVTTSMMTPPFSISASPRFTRLDPTLGAALSEELLVVMGLILPSSIGVNVVWRQVVYWLPRPRGGDLAPNISEKLRDRFGPRHDREEVGIECPPGNDVLVQVPGDAGTGDPALIHAQVEAITRGYLPKHLHRRLRQATDLGHLLCS